MHRKEFWSKEDYVLVVWGSISMIGSPQQCIQFVHSMSGMVVKQEVEPSQMQVLQTSFGYISINSLSILTVSMATESPWKDLSICTSHVLRQSVMAEILGRSTGNHHGTIY